MSADPIIDPHPFADLLDAIGHPGPVTACGRGAGGAFITLHVGTPQEVARLAEALPAGDMWFGVCPVSSDVKPPSRGTADQVVALPAVWADLDVKPGGLPSWDTARAVVDDLADLLEVAPSAVVNSGHGLQPYWALSEPVTLDDSNRADTAALLRRFGRLVGMVAERHGGLVDSVFDLPRVLRVPGTTNTKGTPVPVVLESCSGTVIDVDTLVEVLDDYGVPDVEPEAVGEVLHPHGSWAYADQSRCGYVRAMVAGWEQDTPGARHPWLVSQATRIAAAHRAGCLTEADHRDALAALSARFAALCARGGDTRKVAPGEMSDAVGWGIRRAESITDPWAELGGTPHAHTEGDGDVPPWDRQGAQAPPEPTPEERTEEEAFWEARPSLTHVRDFARARRAGPLATLGCVLARVIGAVPPFVVLPPIVGSEASLNAFFGLVGPSGAGKGAAEKAAGDALIITGLNEAEVLTPGSGEGIAHMFGRWNAKAKAVERHRTAAILNVAEVDTLTALNSRQGATLDPEMRKAFMGEALGFGYADQTKRIPIAAHSYRMCAIVGIQPARAAGLLGSADGGTPQRYLWLPVDDPDAPDERPPEPAPMRWRSPTWPTANGVGHVVLNVCPEAVTTIEGHRLRTLRNDPDVDPLDGHLHLTRLKAAVGLALLDGYAGVRLSDWELAEVLMRRSGWTRSGVQFELARLGLLINRYQGLREADRALIVEEKRDERLIAQATTVILRAVERHTAAERHPDGGCPRRCLKDACGSKYRDGLEDALDRCLEGGRLVEVRVAGTGQPGSHYRRGDVS